MKNILTLLCITIFTLSFSQTPGNLILVNNCPTCTVLPLRTFTDIPDDECYYLRDTNNELSAYEGTWKGSWNNKTIFITFKKITNQYDDTLKYNKDFLIAKYKTVDITGNILFDNTSLPDHQAKIKGSKFRKGDDKYGLIYIDADLCYTSGSIRINFTDSTKTQLAWSYGTDENWIDTDCFFYSLPENQRPEPLPKNIILTKQ